VPPEVLLAVADDVRQAVARLDVDGLSVRVTAAEEEAPAAASGG
jgi:hypothetical protein